MEGCITDVRKTIVEKLLNKAIEKSSYFFCFTRIVKEFNEEKDKLKAERATMGQHFKVATEKGKEIQSNAEFWEKQADKLIQENIETKQRYFLGFCPDCIWRYKRGEELATKTKVIKSLVEKREKFENIEITRCLPGVERHSSQYYIPFKSRELKYKELLDALKDDSNYMVGLHGMGGTGKTTLAIEVGKELKQSEQFAHVIDTAVSFTPDIKKIQDDIAGTLGLKWEDCNESDRPKKLWSRLTNGEKILVILDDVWENLNFADIGLPNSDNHNGCKVLVTTRKLRVCEQMGCGKTIQLELLTEEDTWIMFKMYADLSNISSKSILDKGRKIAIECKRLPVAIATIASSLKDQKSREEWDVALNSLKKPVSMGNVDDDLVDIFKCLKFSYDYLKDEKAKGLFLLCSAFPEDEEISVEDLTRLGIGVNLFGEVYDKYDDARSQAIVAKNKLLHSCLLLETEKGDVKMHDLVREVAQWIANGEILVVDFSKKNQKSLVERNKNIKYLLFQGNLMNLFFSRFDGSKIQILIVKTSMRESKDVPTSFFKNMVGLRVLKLLNSFNSFGRNDPQYSLSLPKSIQLMVNIRSLLFENVNLGDISVLGSLQSLETLELHSCKIDEFSPEIAMLNKLRLLSLRWCEIRSNNPFEVIQRCQSLEELYFCHSFNHFCQEITLPTLERYLLIDKFSQWNGSQSKGVALELERYLLIDKFSQWNGSQSKGVALEGDRLSEATYKYVMKTSYYLHLIRIQGWINLMPEIVPIDPGMNDLIELHLEDSSQLQFLVDTKHNNSQVPIFSMLVVLKLKRMETLEELCNGPISCDSMNNLEELCITYCVNLRSLFQCSLNLSNLKTVTLFKCSRLVSVFELSTSQSLPLLEELKIFDCEKLENIITFERRADTIEELADGYDDNKSCYSLFPKLKDLSIEKCPQLQFILPILSARDLLFLEHILIKSCHKVKYIFGQHQDAKLPSLKQFRIADLPNFIDIFPPNASSISKDGSKLQTQQGPIKGNTFSLCCYRYKLKSTKTPLDSEDQPQDCSISMESIALRMLETLTIVKCDELKQIIIDSTGGNNFGNVFPKLKRLHVEDCVQLEYIFGHNKCLQLASGDFIKELSGNEENGQQMNLSLESIELRDLPMMWCLFVGLKYSFVLNNLTRMEIIRCEKLEIVFSTSVLRCLPQLVRLEVTECRELKHIIEDNLEDKISQSSNTFFPKLETLIVTKCDKLKYVFPQLEILEVEECRELKHIIEDDLEDKISQSSNTFFPKLKTLIVRRCDKLKYVFPVSICKYVFPQLEYLEVKECRELKHIIEDDLEDKISRSSNTFFPKLKTLVVEKCDKLKYVFPVSICKEFPELKFMLIREANELEEIFKSEVEIPNLKWVGFANLPSLCHAQEVHFQAVKRRLVHSCQKLSLTSWNIEGDVDPSDFVEDYDLRYRFERLQRECRKAASEHKLTSPQELMDQHPLGETDTMILLHELMNKQLMDQQCLMNQQHPLGETDTMILLHELMNKQLMDQQCLMNQQHPLGETDTTNKPSQEYNLEGPTSEITAAATVSTVTQEVVPKQKGIQINVEEGSTSANAKTITSSTHLDVVDSSSGQLVTSECKTSSQLEGSTSEITAAATVSTITETNDKPPTQEVVPKQKGIQINVEEGTASSFAKTITSSTHSDLIGSECKTSSQEDGDSQIAMTSFSVSTIETNDQGSLNHDSFKKVSPNIEEQFPKDDDITVSKSKPSPSITSTVVYQFPPVPCKEELFNGHNAGDENASAETTVDFAAGIEIQEASEHNLTSPQLEGSTSEITEATTVSTITETENKPATQEVVPKLKDIQTNVEGNTSANAKTITSSTHSDVAGSSSGQLVTSECKTSSQVDGDSRIAMASFSISTSLANNQGSLINHDSFKKVSSNIEEQFPKDEDKSVSTSKPSPSITSVVAYQFPSMPCKEDPSQNVEDLSSSLLVKNDLEQLDSKNHLDCGNLSLLTDFFVTHPSICLKDTSLSNGYKGCAYNVLAKLLKFLKTHSILEVLGSFHSEFVELLQDARSFGFDKDWLDGVERRALFPDIQVSQDALQKLLDSKQQVTKDVEVLRLKIGILSQHVEDLKQQLTSSEAVLESIIQQEVVLRVPIGY